MNRLFFSAALVMGLLSAGAIAAPRKGEPSPPDYLPTAVGTRWVYDFDGGEQILQVTDVAERSEAKVVTLKEYTRSGWVPAERVAVTARGLLKSEFAGHALEPYYLLKFPIKSGDAWDFEIPWREGLRGVSGTTTVLGEEQVKVPAGTFKAVKVERVIKTEWGKPLAKPEKITVWYAPGIGRVKVTHSEGCNLELKSFTLGRP